MKSQQTETLALPASSVRIADYVQLMKLRLSFLAAIISAAGYYIASTGRLDWARLIHTFIATNLVSAGACALNMYIERDIDSLMERTKNRPLPQHRISADSAFFFGLALAIGGILYLALAAGMVAGAVGALAVATYVLCYTPLKRLSAYSVIVGAVPGALPPVIGWAAARGTLDMGALIVFIIMFLWQLPHFMAIAWIYRDDYRRAGMPMPTVVDPQGGFAGRQMVIYAVALLIASLIPVRVGMVGYIYGAGAAATGLWYLWLCVAWMVWKDTKVARTVFLVSLLHITVLFVLMVIDKRTF